MMEFYGLREQPFAATADPGYLYVTREVRECLFRIWAGIEGGHGPTVVLGAPGAGKTALMRKLLSDMPADSEEHRTAVIASPDSSWTTRDLLDQVLDRFLVSASDRSAAGQSEALSRYLLDTPHRNNLLIIDEAQNLTGKGQLEFLRLALNIEAPQRKLLNLVLFAQDGWVETLRRAPGFIARADTVFMLSPLSVDDARDLIEFRLGQAGAIEPETIFSVESVRLLHDLSGGMPGTLVTLCRNAMLIAGRIQARPLEPEVVRYVATRSLLSEPERLDEASAEASPEDASKSVSAYSAEQSETPAAESNTRRGVLEERANQLLLRARRERPE